METVDFLLKPSVFPNKNLNDEKRKLFSFYARNEETVDFLLKPLAFDKETALSLYGDISSRYIRRTADAFIAHWLLDNNVPPLVGGYNFLSNIIKIKDFELCKRLISLYPNYEWDKHIDDIINASIKDERILDLYLCANLNLKGAKSILLRKPIEAGNINLIKRMIASGVNTTDNDYYCNPLLNAVRNEKLDVVDYLLSINVSSFDTVYNNYTQKTDTVFALAVSKPDIFIHMLNNIKHIEKSQLRRAMYTALDNDNTKLVRILLDMYEKEQS